MSVSVTFSVYFCAHVQFIVRLTEQLLIYIETVNILYYIENTHTHSFVIVGVLCMVYVCA